MRSRWMMSTLLATVLAAWISVPAGAASVEELEKQFVSKIDELMPGMGAGKIEDRKESQIAFERICFENSAPGKATEREAICRAIMKRVGPDVAMPARIWLLRKVEPIGRDEVVEGLTALLAEKNQVIRDLARRALQNNPSPKAGAALRAELGKSKGAPWRVALINALAFRRDTEAAPQLAKLANAKNPAVATAAIVALGRIGDDFSAESLAYLRKNAKPELKSAVVDASFEVAEALVARGAGDKAAAIYQELNDASQPENVRITAIQGIAASKGADAVDDLMKLIDGSDERLQLAAARSLQRIPGGAVTQKLTAAMTKASRDAQVVLIDAIGQRGDRSALAAVSKQLEATDPEVRTTAIAAMRYLGNGTVVATLAKLAAQATGPERDAARESLKWMQGKDVDDAIMEQLGKAENRVNAELVRAAAVRLMKPTLPTLLMHVNDPDESVRVPVIYNIGKLAGPADLNKVLKAFSKLEAGKNTDTAREALVRICSRIGDEAKRAEPLISTLATAEPTVQIMILQTLAGLRGQPALDAIRSCTSSANPQVKEAAHKALAEWGPIHCLEWVFSGPYAKDGSGASELFDTAFAPEEANGAPEWKPLKGQKGRNVDLERMAKKDNCCGYLKTQLISEKDQEVVLSFGSDDGIKVWCNDTVILSKNLTRGLNVDEDKVTVKLKKGANPLLVKVTNGGGQWAFSCGAGSVQGGPADGVKFEAK